MVELIPVIEFEPSSYSHKDRRGPSATSDQDPEAWQKYWKEALADFGIIELDPVEGSWLVRVSDITQPETINNLLRVHMHGQKIETLDDLEFIGSIDGGYVLKTETHAVLPTCCVSLEDIASWEMASDWQKPDWDLVWIGHPWIYCRHRDSRLEFTLHTESSEGLEAAFAVRPDELQTAVKVARETVVDFGKRLRIELEKIVPQELVDFTLEVLLWGNYPP